ncbi:unnamed protein product, partial [Musa acuminata subsp. burmannicoides]
LLLRRRRRASERWCVDRFSSLIPSHSRFRPSRWTRSTKAAAGATKTFPQQAGTIRKMGYIVTKEDGHARFVFSDHIDRRMLLNVIYHELRGFFFCSHLCVVLIDQFIDY